MPQMKNKNKQQIVDGGTRHHSRRRSIKTNKRAWRALFPGVAANSKHDEGRKKSRSLPASMLVDVLFFIHTFCSFYAPTFELIVDLI